MCDFWLNQKSHIHHTYVALQWWWRLEAKGHSSGSHGGLQFRCSLCCARQTTAQSMSLGSWCSQSPSETPAICHCWWITAYVIYHGHLHHATGRICVLLTQFTPVNITNTTQHYMHERIPGNQSSCEQKVQIQSKMYFFMSKNTISEMYVYNKNPVALNAELTLKMHVCK